MNEDVMNTRQTKLNVKNDEIINNLKSMKIMKPAEIEVFKEIQKAKTGLLKKQLSKNDQLNNEQTNNIEI
jgi:hypothetical protein